jgi:hypothetical protein
MFPEVSLSPGSQTLTTPSLIEKETAWRIGLRSGHYKEKGHKIRTFVAFRSRAQKLIKTILNITENLSICNDIDESISIERPRESFF